MDYRYNIDHRDCREGGLSYNQVFDIADVEGSDMSVTEPVTLEEVKNFCKIDVSDDDILIDLMITACRMECEELTNIGFVQRQVIVEQNNGNGGCQLPLGPVGEITNVKDTNGNDLTYQAAGTKWKQILTPIHERLVIVYTAGYGTLPAELKLALLECIFYRYDERKQRENAHPPVYLDQLKQHCRVW